MIDYRSAHGGRSATVLVLFTGCLAPLTSDGPALPDKALSVWPQSIVASIGTPVRLTAVLRNSASGAGPRIAWLSRDTARARVDSAGLVTGLTIGQTTIVAVTEGEADSAGVRVTEPTIVGAGDIASCNSNGDEATAALLDGIPGTVIAIGDLVYPTGAPQYFTECYNPSWGRHKDRTRPAVGNHEYYYAPDAAGYFAYFGTRAGELQTGYYSYDLGSWHIIVLNSNIDSSQGSAQERWLRADLASHPVACTLAYWHHPLFTSGSQNANTGMRALWQALYDAGAEVVINGHDHDYERFAPQTPDGVIDAVLGIRAFVVGTGGASLLPFAARVARNSEVRDNTSFGVLKLTLHDASYDWEFVPEPGKTFRDSGTAACH